MKIPTGLILAAILAATTGTTAFAQGAGADTYKRCAGCHGATGTGNAGMKVPPFKSPDAIKATDAALSAAIKNGAGTGAMKMPAYTGKLTDAQIKDVVAYIRTLQK
jgi:mono/diheme cytochrome c family protein